MNVLKPHLRTTVVTLLERGVSHREIERRTGVDRKTIRRYARSADSPTPATGSPYPIEANSPTPTTGSEDERGPSCSTLDHTCSEAASALVSPDRRVLQVSACEPHRAWIEGEVGRGRNAVSIYQELVDVHGFEHKYNSVKRFVAKLRAREPERYDILEFLPGEEAQVDFGTGALTEYRPGRFKRPCLFVMTLKYSGKSFRKTVWKADQETWARLHEEAFHAFGGCPQYWEERWASLRIHGRKKRQVLEMFHEEKPSLFPLPAERFRYFKQGRRTVDDAGLVQINGSNYAALPAAPHSEVTVRISEREIEILGADGQCLRRHLKSQRKGSFTMENGDRLFNPSRESARLLARAQRIGPHTTAFAQKLFAQLGRPGHRALYGLVSLVRTYPRATIEDACGRMLAAECFSYSGVKQILERTHTARSVEEAPLIQTGPEIRSIDEYQAFWDSYSPTLTQEDHHAHVHP